MIVSLVPTLPASAQTDAAGGEQPAGDPFGNLIRSLLTGAPATSAAAGQVSDADTGDATPAEAEVAAQPNELPTEPATADAEMASELLAVLSSPVPTSMEVPAPPAMGLGTLSPSEAGLDSEESAETPPAVVVSAPVGELEPPSTEEIEPGTDGDVTVPAAPHRPSANSAGAVTHQVTEVAVEGAPEIPADHGRQAVTATDVVLTEEPAESTQAPAAPITAPLASPDDHATPAALVSAQTDGRGTERRIVGQRDRAAPAQSNTHAVSVDAEGPTPTTGNPRPQSSSVSVGDAPVARSAEQRADSAAGSSSLGEAVEADSFTTTDRPRPPAATTRTAANPVERTGAQPAPVPTTGGLSTPSPRVDESPAMPTGGAVDSPDGVEVLDVTGPGARPQAPGAPQALGVIAPDPAARPPVEAATAMRPGEVPAALSRQATEMNQAGETQRRLVVRLDPPELGALTLEVTKVGDEVAIVAKTASVEAMRALVRQRADMQMSIESLGMSLSGFDVQTGSGESGQPRQRPRVSTGTQAPQRDERFEQSDLPQSEGAIFL